MTNSTLTKLQQAYRLVKNRDFLAARPLVVDVLREDKTNLDGWWLAVYVAESDKDKRMALSKVLALAPDHAAAKEMLRRMNSTQPRPKKLMPSATVKRKKSSLPLIFGCVGVIGILFTALAIYDSITGANVLRPVQKEFVGEGTTYGWVEANGSGKADPGEERIPIVNETRAEYNKIQNDTLFRGEAHSYKVVGQPNDTILIVIVFSKDLVGFSEDDLIAALSNVPNIDPNNRPKPDVPLIELWDDNHQLLVEGSIGDIPGTQLIEYTPRKRESLKIIITGRDGAPSGNYFLQVTSASSVMELGEGY